MEKLVDYYNNMQKTFCEFPAIYYSKNSSKFEFDDYSDNIVDEIAIKELLKKMLLNNSNLFIAYTNAFFSSKLIDFIDIKTQFKYSDTIFKIPIDSEKILIICKKYNIKIFDLIKDLL